MAAINNTDNHQEIRDCLTIVMKKYNVDEYSYEILGNTAKGDGFLGNILFVKVTEKSKNPSSNHDYNFVLKCGKKNKHLRAILPIRDIFLNEIFVYEQLLPALQQLQRDRGCDDDIFSCVATCHGTLITADTELIVLDNLNFQQYRLFDKTRPMNVDHVRMVLVQYGRLHAASMALKTQTPPAVFDAMMQRSHDFAIKEFVINDVLDTLTINFSMASSIFANGHNRIVSDKLRNLANGANQLFKEIFYGGDRSAVVFCHGDGWNNNFMFKYKNADDDGVVPCNLVILDWQITRIMSPAIDPIICLYTCASKDELQHFDELLRDYYNSFARHLRELGGDPDELYSFDHLLDDWRKYAKYALILLPTILKVSLCCVHDCPDVSGTNESNSRELGKAFLLEVDNKSAFNQRFRHIVEHFVERDFL